MTTKILALTDALGNLVRFILLPGQRFDTVGVPPLIEGLSFGALIADKAFDSNTIITDLNERGAKIVVAAESLRELLFTLATEHRNTTHPFQVSVETSDRTCQTQAGIMLGDQRCLSIHHAAILHVLTD